MKFLILCLLAILFIRNLNAQLTGNVVDTKGNAIRGATISVLQAADSTVVSINSTDSSGQFRIKLGIGSYFLKISSIGFVTKTTKSFEIVAARSVQSMLPIILIEDIIAGNEVMVTGRKQLIQSKENGKIINIQSSLMTKGSNGLQILERLPGVITDRRNNQFSLNGQSGVTILFNGRRVPLSNEEVISLLESTLADDIDHIELISSPSAKYDAEGAGGLINIVFKKNQSPGSKLSLVGTLGYGYGEKGSGSIAYTKGFKKWNFYTSYSFVHDIARSGYKGTGTSERLLSMAGNRSTYEGFMIRNQNNHNINSSVEFRPNKQNSFAANILLSINNSRNAGKNPVEWDFFNGDFLSLKTNSDLENQRSNILSSFNWKHNISENSQFGIDASYINYKNYNPAFILSRYYDREGKSVMPTDSNFTAANRSTSSSKINVGVISLDYSLQINKNLLIELGLKGSYSKNNNDSKVERLIDDNWSVDPRSQSVIYGDEKIAAGYLQARKTFASRSTIQTGLRYEFWERNINVYTQRFRLSQLLPSLMYEYRSNNEATLRFSYLRRVTRPAYTDLISNLFYTDPTFVFSGNPLLKPTITDLLKAEYNYKQLQTGLAFQYDIDPILRYQITSNKTNEIGVSSPQNLDYLKSLSLFITYNWKISNWFTGSLSSTTSVKSYRLSYSLNPATKTFLAQNINGKQNFMLPKNFEIELSGWYNLPFFEGANATKALGILNAGIAKKMNRDKGVFQLTFPDVFRSFSVHTHMGAVTAIAFNINGNSNWRDETSLYRVVKLTYSRSFGNRSAQQKQVANEELDRLK